jgi:hypothetical protein
MEYLENFVWEDKLLACIIRAEINPQKTIFVTHPDFKQQVGFIVYPNGGEIRRHVHRPIVRHLIGTSEVLIVRRGHCEIDIYDDNRHLVATRQLREGDIVILAGGGHGFRMLKDTVLLEIKQGPYSGLEEKELF